MRRLLATVFWVAMAIGFMSSAVAEQKTSALNECVLTTLDENKALDTKALSGKVIYLDFWASWCGPCAKSFPFMRDLHQGLGAKGLQLIGVNLDESSEDAKAFLEKNPANFPIVVDKNGECAKKFEVKAMPSSYLIGRDGVIRHVQLGFRSDEQNELRQTVEQLLAEKATRP